MPLLREARMYARFLGGLRAFVRNTTSPEQAREAIRVRLEQRQESLLRMAERGFFGLPESPYRELLRLAGCEIGDFRRLVADHGIEGALRELRAAGIHFTFEEFKGREPVVRAGREIPITPGQFDNPYLSHYFGTQTGGSTGRPVRVSTDLEHLAVQAEQRLVGMDAYGVSSLPYAIWRPPLPSGSGINSVLRGAHWGRPPERWFTPLVHSDFRPSLKFRLANSMTVALGRFHGSPMPWPESVPLEHAVRIAEWMRDARDRRGGAVLNTTASNGVRVAVAAREAGIDLERTWLYVAGEPATAAKMKRMRESGASVMTDYGAAETGRIGFGCPNRDDADLHVLLDTVAIIGYPRETAMGETVTSFHITTLHPSAPKLLFNVEFDDCGTIDEPACGCPLEAIGMTQHLRGVRSFGKLVGEGVSLLASEMAHIIEDVLPSRFGGSPLDYQIEEYENAAGLTALTLVINPRVDVPDEADVAAVVMVALAGTSAGADVARAFWQQSRSLTVRRGEPHVTPRGKQPLLYKRGSG